MNCRRIATLILLLLLATGLAVFATGQGEEETQNVVIMVGSHGQYLIQETLEAFMAENPSITVEAVAISSVPQESWQTYTTMFAAQDGSAHIVGMYPTDVVHMAEAGWLTNLSELYESSFEQELKKFNQPAVEINTVGGTLYGVPLYADALLLYYRKDLLEKYGFQPPETWDELSDQVQAIKAGENNPNMAGYIFQAPKIEGVVCNFVNFQSGVGGEIMKEGKIVLDSPKNREALRFMVGLVGKGIAPESVTTHNPNDDSIQFGNGNAIFMNNWPFALNKYLDSESKVYGKVGITRMVGNDQPGASCLGGVSIGINNFSEDKDAAWEFVKYITNYEWNKQRAIRSSLLPARDAVYQDSELLEKNPAFKLLAEGAQYLKSRPTHQTKYYIKLADRMQYHFNKAMLGMQTPEEALANAQAEMEKILAEAD